ncbi:MAG: CRISPR-associated endonuclease Cas1 [Anaerolineales bacterium]|nr:CRISPR-associated endonuclease Cas1 [Anaerolineales bacterium]
MATLYVTEPGARLEKEYQRLRVVKEEQTLLVTPLARVNEVVLVGRVGVTTPAILALLEAGVGLTYLSWQGHMRGRLTPTTGKNLPLRRQQYRQAEDPAFCLGLSRAIVAGKLRNSRTLARRMVRSGAQETSGQVERLKQCLKSLTGCADIAGVMGQEGHGAKAYFAIFRAALNTELAFGPRSRRPPKDPVNSLLGLGYSLLTASVVGALEIVGLDPYCGFFHGTAAYGRPALALDLMEEFRSIIVDSVVLTLVNKRMLTAKDFEDKSGADQGGGVYLKPAGRRVFFEQYSQRLNTAIYHPAAGRTLSYQKVLEVQARQLAKAIRGEIDAYEPFLVK